ncbi:MAG: hypothetical protein L3K24_01275 [Gammaproteobacteria bacterium]|nr:hypothetical protein [Gammaproteobacteria bacterium]
MFPFLKPTQLLDEATVQWMFDSFAWALRNFDARIFRDETILVTPSNAHFPGRESSPEGMSGLIFDRVRFFASMQHWPCQLVDEDVVEELPLRILPVAGLVRAMEGAMPIAVEAAQPLPIIYRADQLRDPEVMIAHFAHTLAHYLGTTANEPPPGGEENWPHVTELLAVFMGFGVVMADSANTARIRSCGSCSGPAVERENYLSQFDVTYALAIFCCLKNIPAREAVKHLKSTLRPFFKRAMKDVMRRESQLQRLREVAAAI